MISDKDKKLLADLVSTYGAEAIAREIKPARKRGRPPRDAIADFETMLVTEEFDSLVADAVAKKHPVPARYAICVWYDIDPDDKEFDLFQARMAERRTRGRALLSTMADDPAYLEHKREHYALLENAPTLGRRHDPAALTKRRVKP